ncbi:hypothetical protein [Nocardioides jejuensis]|uniref:Uncharacterized protein n=1 Tax=Nocardioides jejuensis TaxID=2502782 RepID=A0A4V2NZU0_9ACTN|nr:hypothetical protein [Nocardioides jejuensis]TCJ30312.1 hypothetical protein EPD65_03645 [Nocardioides jejuensis]
MNARNALVLLAVGALLGAASGLYAVPATALAGAALCVVASTVLARDTDGRRTSDGVVAADAFNVARVGALLGAAGSAMALARVGSSTVVGSLAVVALLLVIRSGSTGLHAALADAWRSAAAVRIARSAFVVVPLLGLALALETSGSGPSWTGSVVDVLRAATLVVAVWFAAFCVSARDAVTA